MSLSSPYDEPDTGAVEAWLHGWDVRGDQVADGLTAARVAHRPLDAAAPRGAGIVCFERFSPELCEFVGVVSRHGDERVIAVSLAGPISAREAWRLLSMGAADVLDWDPSASTGRRLGARLHRWQVVDELVGSEMVRANLVGDCPRWRALLREVIEVARYAPGSLPVLVTGESGTGKELVARLMHAISGAKGKLVTLDCTTVQPSLAGSEFFGHARGSFTGALSMREGAIAMADGGTLFLDEVGELPPALQAELLRVVQEGTYKRIGTDSYRAARFRLICATNRELSARDADFRGDFYHRIAGWTCHLPALRERTPDIPRLVEHFLRELAPTGECPQLTSPVREFLMRREYPGNVRELRHLVARLWFRHAGEGPITLGAIPEDEWQEGELRLVDWRRGMFETAVERGLAHGATLKEITTAAAEVAVEEAVREASGDLQRASSQLGVTPRALQLRRAARRRAAAPTAAPLRPGDR